jgi:hypothetical protein
MYAMTVLVGSIAVASCATGPTPPALSVETDHTAYAIGNEGGTRILVAAKNNTDHRLYLFAGQGRLILSRTARHQDGTWGQDGDSTVIVIGRPYVSLESGRSMVDTLWWEETGNFQVGVAYTTDSVRLKFTEATSNAFSVAGTTDDSDRR